MRRITWMALLGVLLAASGCAALNNLLAGAFKKPRVAFKTAQVESVSLAGATVNLVWTVANPNPIGLMLEDVDYKFSIEGKQLAAGHPRQGLDLPADGRADLDFPVGVQFAELVPALESLFTKEVVAYKAEGSVGIRTPIGVLRFPLVHEGTFPVPRLPQVELATPRITQIGVTGATVEFPLTVTNGNGFPLPVNGLKGALKVAGASVGTLSTGDLGMLEAKSTRQVTLPLRIDFAQALSAANALRTGQATVAFDGALQSGCASVPLRFSEQVRFTR